MKFHIITLEKENQCIIKTQLALSDHKIENRQIILLKEPECHLSYSNLNTLLDKVNGSVKGKTDNSYHTQ